MLNLRYPMEVELVGDAKATLHELIPHLRPKTDHAWRHQIEQNVERLEDIGKSRDMARSSRIPTVVEMVTDPDVPPVPPHITGKQAKAYFSALQHRDPDAIGIVIASAKEWWDGMFPPSRKQ